MIKDKLLKEIKQYCELNEIDDVEKLIDRMLRQGFTMEKHGAEPIEVKPKQKKTNKYEVKLKKENEIVVEEVKVIKPKKKSTDIYGE